MKRWVRVLIALASYALFSAQLPSAIAVNYSVTYYANETMFQGGATTGTVPTTGSYVSGSTVTAAANSGNLARQGFTFTGWNTLANGTGNHYNPGQTFVIGGNVSFYAEWSIPASARLIGSTGSIVTISGTGSVTNGNYCAGGMRGITSDGTYIYFRSGVTSANGYLCKAKLDGTLVSVFNVGGTLTSISQDSLALTYANGCVFIRASGAAGSTLYCIDISDGSFTTMTQPSGKLLFAGQTWLNGNLITFPDGRIGAVSAPNQTLATGTGAGQCPSGMYCKILRLYTLANSGKSTTLTFSEDIILADNSASWPSDDHGIATDGTYLYQINYSSGYKVYALASGSPSYLVFDGVGTGSGSCAATSPTYCAINSPNTGLTMSNATYIGRSHLTNQYLMGDYNANSFWLSASIAPPPGPGNPDITPPSFTSTDTFTVSENISTTFNAATITVNDSATLTIAAGLDGSLFTIAIVDTATAYIRFNVSPDFEGPTDTGGNNQYDITIRATDSVGNVGSRTINIRVTNVNEAATIPAPTVAANVYKGITTSLSITVNAPGKVRFFVDGKRIAGCLSVATTGTYPNYVATCNWEPATMSRRTVTAQLTPSDLTFTGGLSPVLTVWVLKRTTLR